MNTTEQDVSSEEIARRAYELWEERGCPPGDGSEDWERAVAELTAGRCDQQEADGKPLTWFARVRRKVLRKND